MVAALAFHGVHKRYRRQAREAEALRGVTAVIEAGSRVAVVGRSGSGKSTLLHLAAGIDVPTEGRVEAFGRDLQAMDEAGRTRFRRDAVGLVFQFFHLLPHLTVLENVALPGWIAGEGRATGARAEALLERVGLGDRRDDPVDALSGGEMQRVALCRALLRRPRLLLADEPTGNLDDEHGRQVMDLLLELVREQGATLLYVTHSVEFAALADRTLLLHSGQLEA